MTAQELQTWIAVANLLIGTGLRTAAAVRTLLSAGGLTDAEINQILDALLERIGTAKGVSQAEIDKLTGGISSGGTHDH